MGRFLLLVELTAVLLLTLAWCWTWAARRRHAWARRLAVGAGILLTAIVPTAALLFSCWLTYVVQVGNSLRWYSFTLAGGYALGVGVLTAALARRRVGGVGRGWPEAAAAAAWPRGRIAAGGGVAMVLLFTTFWNLDTEVRANLSTVRAQAGAQALAVAPARVPDSLNAGLVYQECWSQLEGAEPADGILADKAVDDFIGGKGGLDADRIEDLRRRCVPLEPLLAQLRRAGKMRDCYFERTYNEPSIALLLPGLGGMRSGARLLALDARLKVRAGQTAAAIEDVNTIFAMARHMSTEPVLVSALVSMAMDETGRRALEDVLRHARPAAADLEAVEIDPLFSHARSLTRSMRMEEAFGLYTMGGIGWDFGLDALMLIASCDGSGPNTFTSGMAILSGPIYRVFMVESDIAGYRRCFSDLRRLAAKPYAEARAELKARSDAAHVRQYGLLPSVLLPALSACFELGARQDAGRRCALAGVAAYRHHQREGRWPDRIEQLAGPGSVAASVDPFDGKALRLKAAPTGIVIYSIGPDLVDDGGKPFDNKTKTGDIGFTAGS
jgi:hypothetical protein